jgi:hypothetical protein
MKIAYASTVGTGPTYEIETDRHGSYTIRQSGLVVKRVTSITNYVGRPRWGSRRLELTALAEAKAAIDAHHALEARAAHQSAG